MNKYISSENIRNLFIKYFKYNNHHLLDSSSLIPKNDNSILFTNSGMNQFKNILLGLENPVYKNIVTIQKCVRVGGKHNDLYQVGKTLYHNTFFEMLGNFSFNNYFKKESIEFAYKLITGSNWFNISKNKLFITVHTMDEESYNIWLKIGINNNRIIKIGSNKNLLLSNNFWRMSEYGPCGFSSEIFYTKIDIDKIYSIKKLFNSSLEIWNLVFMEFNHIKKNIFSKLPYNSIDTGMGLERISSVLQGVDSVYDIDIFKKIIKLVTDVTNYNSSKINIPIKIISDHIRTIIFIINENVYPTNEGRGYILRKIIRRSICYGIILGIKTEFLYKFVNPIIKIMNFYNRSFNNTDNIVNIIFNEENKFLNCIKYPIKILEEKILSSDYNDILDGKFIFKLHDTYGLPIILIENILNNKNIKYDKNKFKYFMNIQKNKSKFKK